MDPITFQRWLSKIAPLTDPQRRSTSDAIRIKDLEPQMNTDAHGCTRIGMADATMLVARVFIAKQNYSRGPASAVQDQLSLSVFVRVHLWFLSLLLASRRPPGAERPGDDTPAIMQDPRGYWHGAISTIDTIKA
jgi:hypothetical protein